MKPCVHIINSAPGWVKTPPLSLAYLQSFLNGNNTECRAIDLNLRLFKLLSQEKNQWLALNSGFENNLFANTKKSHPGFIEDILEQLQPATVIGLSILKRSESFTMQLAAEIHKKYPNKRIVIGGPHTMVMERENRLNPDYTWVIGEGESPLLEIVKGSKEKIFRFKEIKDLDTLPPLNFSGLNLKDYQPVIPLFSSRGCHFKCAFCSEKLLYRKVRRHSPQYMIDLIEKLKTEHKISTIIFCDSMINSDIKWLEDLCTRLIAKKLNIKWEAQMRVTPGFPRHIAELMQKSGCYNLFIGLESAADKNLKAMNKGYDRSTALGFLTTLNHAGLHYEISLITGYPDESENDFDDTVKFIQQNKNIIPKIAQINPFIDYLNDYPKQTFPTPQAAERVNKLLKMLEEEKIRFTKGFINNLIY